MTQKQTILGRISQLARANVNALLDRAEDPEKMLDQLIRDYTNSIAEAEEAVAQTIANVRMAEADLQTDRDGAYKVDNLARVALSRQIQHESEISRAEPTITQQNDTVEQLKAGLTTMKT